MSYKNLLKEMFQQVFTYPDNLEDLINHYVHPDYRQYVDDKVLTREGLLNHLLAQKDIIEQVDFDYAQLIEEGNTVASIHYVEAKKKDGGLVKAKVIAMIKFQDNQLLSCHELTKLLAGDEQDHELGSITK